MIYLFQFSLLPFAGTAVVFFVVQFIYFPETKNRQLRELSNLFQQPNGWTTAIGFKGKSKNPSLTKSKECYGSITKIEKLPVNNK